MAQKNETKITGTSDAAAGNTDGKRETQNIAKPLSTGSPTPPIRVHHPGEGKTEERKRRPATTILIICGGSSHERDISMSSGHRVGGYLRDAGWQVVYHDMDGELLSYLSNPVTRPGLVWPLLHGANGEDGSIRDIIELEKLPYIGSRAKASETAWHKPIAKNVIRKLGKLHTPASVTLPEELFRELGVNEIMKLLTEALGLPLFVKPVSGGSAMGCTLVKEAGQLAQAMVDCFAYADVALIERAVQGTEVSVSILDIAGSPLVLPPLEIVTPNGTYDYEARYTPGPTKFYVPARLSPEVLQTVQDAALVAHRTLSLRDISARISSSMPTAFPSSWNPMLLLA